MFNPIYQMMNPGAVPTNPLQRIQMVRQAMTNPVAFVANAFPDIPEGMRNDPNQIISYLQQTRGITNEQIQSIQQIYSMFMR